MRLASSGRTIKQQSLFDGHPERQEFVALLDKAHDVAFEEREGLFRQDDLIASDGPETVDFDAASAAAIVVARLEGNYLAAIRAGFVDGLFNFVKQPSRKVDARVAGRHHEF